MASPRAKRSDARRGRVLAAVLELHRKGGSEAVTIASVGKLARASTGSIYHQFGDKDGLLDAAFESLIEAYRAHVRTALGPAAEAKTPRAYVRALVTAHLAWVFAHPDEARLLFRARRGMSGDRAQAARRGTGAFAAEILEGLRTLGGGDAIVPMPAALATAVILGPAQEIARQWLGGRLPNLEPEPTIRTLADAAWRAVRRE